MMSTTRCTGGKKNEARVQALRTIGGSCMPIENGVGWPSLIKCSLRLGKTDTDDERSVSIANNNTQHSQAT